MQDDDAPRYQDDEVGSPKVTDSNIDQALLRFEKQIQREESRLAASHDEETGAAASEEELSKGAIMWSAHLVKATMCINIWCEEVEVGNLALLKLVGAWAVRKGVTIPALYSLHDLWSIVGEYKLDSLKLRQLQNEIVAVGKLIGSQEEDKTVARAFTFDATRGSVGCCTQTGAFMILISFTTAAEALGEGVQDMATDTNDFLVAVVFRDWQDTWVDTPDFEAQLGKAREGLAHLNQSAQAPPTIQVEGTVDQRRREGCQAGSMSMHSG
jgi:hypothetical protein